MSISRLFVTKRNWWRNKLTQNLGVSIWQEVKLDTEKYK